MIHDFYVINSEKSVSFPHIPSRFYSSWLKVWDELVETDKSSAGFNEKWTIVLQPQLFYNHIIIPDLTMRPSGYYHILEANVCRPTVNQLAASFLYFIYFWDSGWGYSKCYTRMWFSFIVNIFFLSLFDSVFVSSWVCRLWTIVSFIVLIKHLYL